MTNNNYDILIVGGGMVGASLACALGKQDLRVGLIEAVSLGDKYQPSYDDRGLALSLSSQRILQALDVWSEIVQNANQIKQIHVSDRGHFGFVRLRAELLNLNALGYVVIARELGQALLSRVSDTTNVDFICPAEVEAVIQDQTSVQITLLKDGTYKELSGKLLVVADGTHSKIRKQLGIEVCVKEYGQTAIVSNVTPQRPHQDTAYERFTDSGPLALLPFSQQRCMIVFTVHTSETTDYMDLNDAGFLDKLEQRFGRRLGKFMRMGERKSYPLLLLEPQEQIRERIVLLGNSAHTIHPNGAQGFNLCLRDVAALAELIRNANIAGEDLGSKQILNRYVSSRQFDQRRVIDFTDHLAGLFYNQSLPKIITRNAGMLVMDTLPFIKRDFIRRSAGLWGRQPAMVRGT